MPFLAIGKELGISGPSAYGLVMRALKNIPAPEVEELRRTNLERLNVLRSGYWPKAISGDLKAVQSEINVQEREANYLGLDQQTSALGSQPINIQVNVVYEKAPEPTP